MILFIGDGMGISTITAARIYAGQQKGLDGESYQLAMEKLPYSAFSKTYTHDSQVADSAPTAVAMTTGVKSYNGTLGVTQGANIKDCATAKANGTTSLWEIAEDGGMATGVISTARVTHATPAATYAETTERDWESDADVRRRAKLPAASISPRSSRHGRARMAMASMSCCQADGQASCPARWPIRNTPTRRPPPRWPQPDGRVEGGARPHARVTDRAGFNAFNWNSDGQILGLFEPSHMQYDLDREGRQGRAIDRGDDQGCDHAPVAQHERLRADG